MKKMIFTSISILIFSICSFAQTEAISPCLMGVTVNNYRGIESDDNTITFLAELNNEVKKSNAKYTWVVENAVITTGQGTSSIKVSFSREELKGSIVATVMVSNLPKGCENVSADDWIVFEHIPESKLFDQFSTSDLSIDKAKLKNYAIALQNEPTSASYIYEKIASEVSQKSAKIKINKIINYLVRLKIDKAQIGTKIIKSNENSTQLWIVPAGVSAPIP